MHFMNFDNLFTHFSDYICYYSNHARASFFRDENGSLAVLIYSSYNYYELCPWRKVMAAYRWVYDLRLLQADCQEPGSTPEPYAR